MGEHALRGVSAAPGVRTGKAFVLDRPRPMTRTGLPAPDRGREMDRATLALKAAAADMQDLATRLREAGRTAEAEIVETGVLMAEDPGFFGRVEALVRESGLPADAALAGAAEKIALELANIADPTLALRADDVRSLGRRAAAHARGGDATASGGVLIATTLGPADVADLSATGVALAGGGVTAHAAIVARSLGIPMVVGLGPEVLDVADGEEVVLDGDSGLLVRSPDAHRVAAARAHESSQDLARAAAREQRLQAATTRDGRRISVFGNAASVAEVIEAGQQGAEGIGLLRTELGFLEARDWPTSGQHMAFMRPILERLAGQIATVRLLDFGGDKTPPFLKGVEGRGIELLLLTPEALKAQLGAIIATGADTRLRILIPMVTSAAQVRIVHELLGSVLDGRPAPQVGSMIETPDAARRAVEIAEVSDFLSIGTNDLTQLVLGLDREHSRSAPVTDVRVLRLIDATMRAGRAAGIPVDVCGEAASDENALPILVGLGVDELSVAAARVGEVRMSVRGLDYTACCAAAAKLLLDKAADAARERR